MTAQGPRKGEPSSRSMRNGFRTQPARLVRGSSRRIMTMRFRPANIRVINRRVCCWAVIGPAVPKTKGERNLRFLSPLESPFFPQRGSELTSRNVFPPSRPSKLVDARTVLAVKGSLRRAKLRRALDRSAPLRPDSDMERPVKPLRDLMVFCFQAGFPPQEGSRPFVLVQQASVKCSRRSRPSRSAVRPERRGASRARRCLARRSEPLTASTVLASTTLSTGGGAGTRSRW